MRIDDGLKRRQVVAAALMVAAVTAQAELVVIAGKGVGEMSKEQVAEIYLGRTSALPGGGTAIVIDLAEGNALREEFYAKVTGKSASQAKSHWAKLAFTGKGTPPKEVAGPADVKKAVATTAGAIGYVDRASVDDSVKVVFRVN